MIRVLLFLLAILVAVLGFVLQRPWLYAAAAVPLAGALALVARRMWSSYSSHRKRPRRSRSGSSRSSSESRGSTDARTSTGPRDESLEDFGIVDVRPQAKEKEKEEATSEAKGTTPNTEAAEEDTPRSKEEAPSPTPKSSDAGSDSAAATTTKTSEASSDDTEPDATSEENGMPSSRSDAPGHPLLTPYVEALRVALNAHTVCFLVQAEMALDYEIRAMASESEHVRHSGTFETTKPLLTPQMMEDSITIRPLDSPDVVSSYLGYYREPAPIDHVALAPVSVSGEPDVYFLLADTTGDVDLSTKRAGTLLRRFADTLSLVLESRSADVPSSAVSRENGGEGEEPDEAAPRPRTEIIAEEMEAADADDAPLSLLLVHLNRAEAIAREGEEAVEETEALFAQRLDDVAASSRVVRFGELTYGIFFRGDADAVEPFAADLQETMDRETGALEGGVSIGVAVRADRHDPESLRADATEALSESYKTGACTIVE